MKTTKFIPYALLIACMLASALLQTASAAPEPTAPQPGWSVFVNSNVARDVVVYKRVAYTATLGGMVAWNLDSGYRMHYTPQKGMGHVSSYAISLCAIPEPRILVGTQAGVSIYDPNTGLWEQKALFPEDSKVATSKISRLYCDAANRRLLVGYYGLGVLDLKTGAWKRYTSKEGMAGDGVDDIAVKGKDIWVANGYKGLSKISGDQVTAYTKATGLPQDSAYALAFGPDGTLWAGGPGGLMKLTANKWTLYGSDSPARLNSISEIEVAADGKIWVATAPFGTGRLCQFVPKDGSCKVDYKEANNQAILGLTLDDKGKPIYTTDLGVYLLDGDKTKAFLHSGDQLATNFVDALANAPDGKLWVGTDGGIQLLDPAKPEQPWSTFRKSQVAQMGGSWGTAIAVAPDGAVWFAMTNGDASRYKDGQWSAYADARSFDTVTVDGNGRAWFGDSGKGIVVLNADGSPALTLKKADGLPSDNVYALLAHKDAVWIGTDQGLAVYKDNKVKLAFGKDDPALPAPYIRDLALDAGQALLIGTSMGVTRYDFNQAEVILDFQKQNLSAARLTTLAAAPNGRIWVGTDQGLYYSDDRVKWQGYTTKDGLLTNYISALLVDASGAAWVGGGGSNFDGGGLLKIAP